MGSVGRTELLSLYKAMLRESQKFSSYNYRNYAIIRIRDAFRENKTLSDSKKVKEQIQKAHSNLAMIKRQVVIGQLYKTEKLVIEDQRTQLG